MYVFTDSELDSYVSAYDDRYEGDGPRIEAELTGVLDAQRYLTTEQLQQAIRWKMNGQPGRAKLNCERLAAVDDAVVRHVTEGALAASAPKLQVEILGCLPGVGSATATVVLTFDDPDDYAVGDRYLMAEVLGEEVSVTPTRYADLLSTLRTHYEDVPLRTVEKAYYMRHLDEQ